MTTWKVSSEGEEMAIDVPWQEKFWLLNILAEEILNKNNAGVNSINIQYYRYFLAPLIKTNFFFFW